MIGLLIPIVQLRCPSVEHGYTSLLRLKLILVAAAIVVLPFTLRAANRIVLKDIPGPGYLPSLELRRDRQAFEAGIIDDLRTAQPAWIFIGDSMLGTRLDARHLAEISTDGTDRAHTIMVPGSGPAWWFLAFKNLVVASGVKPRCTFIFFRDTNLTDTLFRLETQYGRELDMVAGDSEPELDRLIALRRRGPWARIYTAVNRAYEIDIARSWMDPAIRGWLTRAQPEMDRYFGLNHLRGDVASDMTAVEEPAFARDLPSSILPDLLRLANEHQQHVCFVRVQRRPVNNKPPDESPALGRYVADLEAWVEANGAVFRDDTGDPEMTLDLYEDGDHIENRRRYTEILRKRLDSIFR
jgi:hypothetical protein